MKTVHSIANVALIATATLLVSSAASADNGPALHPNSQLYHVRSPSAATGRSGTASLAVRALLGKDGKTAVDVTTGTLDSAAPAPGNLKKVQLKGFNGDGDVAWTRNYTDLSQGGAVSISLDELHRGQPVQTQANITGVSGQRTDVVTVTGNVKLRPDLAVSRVDAPQKAIARTPVSIASTVRELNGDVGATASCVLLVDGAEADRANGIYVDGGSAVTCAFTHKFDVVGSHALEVRVADVVPGDWDTSNNAATGSIEIEAGEQAPLSWWAGAMKHSLTASSRSDGWYSYSDGTYASGQDWHDETNDRNVWQMLTFQGSSPAVVTFPFSHVTVAESADGASVGSFDLEDVPADWSYGDTGWRVSSLFRYDPATSTYLLLYTFDFSGSGATSASLWRYGGAVTYFSRGYMETWFSYAGTEYSYAYNYDVHYDYDDGTWPMTSRAAVVLDIVDASGENLHANAQIPLQAYQSQMDQPYTCFDYDYAPYAEHYCSEYHSSIAEVYGFASGEN